MSGGGIDHHHSPNNMEKTLHKMAPEAVMRLVQAGMTILDLDNIAKKDNPLEGMSTKGRNELAAAVVEGNTYLSSVKEILDEVSQQQIQEERETGPETSGSPLILT